jgi:dihydrofolate synthase/folylpolyglutamate synthase
MDNQRAHITYDQCIEKMFALHRFGIKLGLATIRAILKALGDPQRAYPCIHVAGTNGKGSIASSLASILKAAGFRVGLYTSPHLIRFNERIQINHEPIADQRVAELYEAVVKAHHGRREPTFFEFSTAMAFCEFAHQKCDWAVVETGMGGRLDATNLIRPRISVISNISLEHKAYLGQTLAQIAAEKGGIIKAKVPVVTGVRQRAVFKVLEKIAADKHAPIYRKGKEFRIRRLSDGRFDYFGIHHNWRDFLCGLIGPHQQDNAALVLAACEILQGRNVDLSLEAIRTGLEQARWPGRLEKVSTSPLVLLDGAHNLDAARVLGEYLGRELKDRKITLVVGILDDKPFAAMLKSLIPACSRVIITQPKINRALDPNKLAAVARSMIADVTVIADVGKALHKAMAEAEPADAVCVAGSLYVVGEARAALAQAHPSPSAKIA